MRLALLVFLPLLSCSSDSADVDPEDTASDRVDADGDGYTEAEGDCDDRHASIHSAAPEICDNIDNNCNLEIDEGLAVDQWPDRDGDGYGDSSAAAALSCHPLPGRVINGEDCNDFSTDWNPVAPEVGCDDLNDYNCDGYVENIDDDGDGFPPCIDCEDDNPLVNNGMVETCNGFDDDCDGEIDGPQAAGQPTWYADLDEDGYGNPRTATTTCDAPLGFILEGTDCNDDDPGVVGGEVAPPGSITLSYTGDVQMLDLPNCVREVVIEAYGAEGKRSASIAARAGLGGMASGTLTLFPGEPLYVYVGGNNGYNGGGAGWVMSATQTNGGGASDVRMGGMELEHRVIVAGGGGGSSGDNWVGVAGDGGGGTCGANYCGGAGGDGYSVDGTAGGERGGTSGSGYHGGGGGGGGLESGGAGATADSGGGSSASGGTGTLGVGGAGNGNTTGCVGNGVAGGGGGYYGGGGAAGTNCGAGGGGGGSSWTGTLADPSFAAGVQSGNGQVIITWY